MSKSEADDAPDMHDETGTTNEDYRWRGLSTALALFVGVGFPLTVALHAGGVVDITSVPQWAWLPVTGGWSAVLLYTFRRDVRRALKGE